MSTYSLSRVADHVLVRDLAALVSKDRTTTASLLAHIAEVDVRKLYLPAAFPSMFEYCVGELRLSEDAAFNRVRAARPARKFPAIFVALADGRLHLSAVLRLTPHLTPENADELLAAAVHRTKSEVELLLAQRFPRPDMPTRVQALAPLLSEDPLKQASVEAPADGLALGPVHGSNMEPLVPERVASPAPRSEAAPLSLGRYALQFTIEQEAHDDLGYAQALLGHALPSGDVAKVFGRAMKALIRELERDRFAATDRPGRRRGGSGARHVPAAVKRAVWQRDGGQCTFVSEQGKRCPARKCLEYDHMDPVARGGQTTTERMRLRCRAHNQYTAERVYGAGFMERKREEARRRSAQVASSPG